jgi:hypothetical protein
MYSTSSNAPDWQLFFQDCLALFSTSYPPSWAFNQTSVPIHVITEEDLPLQEGAQTNEDSQMQDEDLSGSFDDLCATIEREIDGIDNVCDDKLHWSPFPDKAWQPKPTALLALLRLTRTFATPNDLARALFTPGSLTLLSTGSGALEKVILKLIQHIVGSDLISRPSQIDPLLLLGKEGVSRRTVASNTVLAGLSEDLCHAIETRAPVTLITSLVGAAPPAIRALQPDVISLAPLDRTMLHLLLTHAYADMTLGADLLEHLPEDSVVSRLSPDQLTLCLRAPTPCAAVTNITQALTSSTKPGFGLNAFPLPQQVRAPLDQLISDMRGWQSGAIAWQDVSRGLLFTGPPGTGKTELARLIANEAGISVIAGSVASWQSSGDSSGDLVRAMKQDFARAAEMAPCLIFIDELDACGDRARNDHNASWVEFVVSALLECLDGFASTEGVVAIGATNFIDRIDAAIRRPGRFDQVIQISHPTPDLLPQAIRWHLQQDLPDTDLSGLAAQAMGMSGAEISSMVRRARANARKARRELQLDDLRTALSQTRPELPKSLRWQIAVHECGHAITGTAIGHTQPQMLAFQNGGGITQQTFCQSGLHRQDIEAHLVVTLGGRAAEVLLLGQPSAGAGGATESDLSQATQTAIAMERSWGLGETRAWWGPPESVIRCLRDDGRLQAKIEAHLHRAEKRACQILQHNRALLEEMATQLMETGLLTGAALTGFIDRVQLEAPTQSDFTPQKTQA